MMLSVSFQSEANAMAKPETSVTALCTTMAKLSPTRRRMFKASINSLAPSAPL
jgi:hypothetical protein